MKILDEDTLTGLLNNCYNNKQYRGIIIFPSSRRAMDFQHELRMEHYREPIKGIHRFIFPPGMRRIIFRNGSSIDISVMSPERGIKYNEVLLEESVLLHHPYWDCGCEVIYDPMDNVTDATA